jgi:hypothetical protein
MSDYEIDDDELTYDEEEVLTSDDEINDDEISDEEEINDADADIADVDIADVDTDIADIDADIADVDIIDTDIADADIADADTVDADIDVDINDKKNSKNLNPKKYINLKNNFLDPPLNKNIVLEKSNKPRTILIMASEDRITSDHLQKSERAALISIRAKQIANDGAPEYLNDIVTEIKKNKINISSNDIADAELLNRRCPLKLRREIGVNSKDELIVEEWDPNDMKIHI